MTSIRRYAWLFAIPVVLLVSGMPAHAATLEISVNYAHDWVSGVTDPSVLVTVTLTDDVGGLKATGTPDPATWTALFARGSSPLMKAGSDGKGALRLQPGGDGL